MAGAEAQSDNPERGHFDEFHIIVLVCFGFWRGPPLVPRTFAGEALSVPYRQGTARENHPEVLVL